MSERLDGLLSAPTVEEVAALESRLADYEERMAKARAIIAGCDHKIGAVCVRCYRGAIDLLTPPAPSSPTPPPAPRAEEKCEHCGENRGTPACRCIGKPPHCNIDGCAHGSIPRAKEGALEPKKSPHGKSISALASIVRLGEPDGATKATWQRTGRELIEREPVVQAVVTIRSAADALHAEAEQLKKERDEAKADAKRLFGELAKTLVEGGNARAEVERLKKERDALRRPSNAMARQLFEERDAAVTARRVAESEAAQLKLDARAEREGMLALRALYGASDGETWASFLQRTVSARQAAEAETKRVREALTGLLKHMAMLCQPPPAPTKTT